MATFILNTRVRLEIKAESEEAARDWWETASALEISEAVKDEELDNVTQEITD